MDNSYRLLDLTVYGEVGGFADRLAATVFRQAEFPYRWTSHHAVVSPEGRIFGRPGNRQALKRACRCLLPQISMTFDYHAVLQLAAPLPAGSRGSVSLGWKLIDDRS